MWYVIQTMTGEEEKMLLLMEKKIPKENYVEMFIPKGIQSKHYKKAWHEQEKKLFPSYIFVDTENIDAIENKLLSIPGLTKLLKAGDEIVPIREEERKYLENLMDANHVVRYSQGFLIGEQVCVTEGALKNFEGHIRKIDRHRRIATLDIALFGDVSTPVEVGFGAFARVTREEWEEDVEKAELEEDDDCNVKVLHGVFAGRRGRLCEMNPSRDVYSVEINLFDKPTKVEFREEEIEVLG